MLLSELLENTKIDGEDEWTQSEIKKLMLKTYSKNKKVISTFFKRNGTDIYDDIAIRENLKRYTGGLDESSENSVSAESVEHN